MVRFAGFEVAVEGFDRSDTAPRFKWPGAAGGPAQAAGWSCQGRRWAGGPFLNFPLDHAGGDFEQPQAQRIELRHPPGG